MYECLFQWLKLRLPLTIFEKKVFEHLQISPLNFTLVDWAFVKKFQQWHEYKGQDNSALVNLLFYIFVVSRTT